ncbi:MAG: metal ABC transporter substrate-binding protein [bacterium]
MKRFLLFLSLLLVPSTVFAKVNIVATLPVFASLAQEVGGDRVSVTSLARGNQDPHFLDAKPSYAVDLNKADLLIEGGLELEVGWLPPVVVQSRNSKILPNAPGNVNLAQGLNILEVPKTLVDRSMGDIHPLGNPHAWLDPRNGKIMAANIFQHLVKVDPEGKAYYEGRLKNFLDRLNAKMKQWEGDTASLRGKDVITFHKSLSYFADWTGLNVVANIEPKPGIPPSSGRVDELLKLIPNYKVKAILVENFYPKKIPEYLAQKANLPMVIVPTDTEEEGPKTYIDLIDSLVKDIKKAVG